MAQKQVTKQVTKRRQQVTKQVTQRQQGEKNFLGRSAVADASSTFQRQSCIGFGEKQHPWPHGPMGPMALWAPWPYGPHGSIGPMALWALCHIGPVPYRALGRGPQGL